MRLGRAGRPAPCSAGRPSASPDATERGDGRPAADQAPVHDRPRERERRADLRLRPAVAVPGQDAARKRGLRPQLLRHRPREPRQLHRDDQRPAAEPADPGRLPASTPTCSRARSTPTASRVGQGCVYPAAVKTVADQLEAAGLHLARLHAGHGQLGRRGEPATCRHPAIGAPRRHPDGAARATSTRPATTPSSTSTRSSTRPTCQQERRRPRQPAGRPRSRGDDARLLVHHPRPLRRRPRRDLRRRRLARAASPASTPSCASGCRGSRPRRPTRTRLILVTFDESERGADSCCGERPGRTRPTTAARDPGSGGGRVGAVMLSPCIKPGTVIQTRLQPLLDAALGRGQLRPRAPRQRRPRGRRRASAPTSSTGRTASRRRLAVRPRGPWPAAERSSASASSPTCRSAGRKRRSALPGTDAEDRRQRRRDHADSGCAVADRKIAAAVPDDLRTGNGDRLGQETAPLAGSCRHRGRRAGRLGSRAVIEDLVNVADFERVAAEKLEAGVLGYFAGGAGDEVTLRDNVAAWGRWQLRPRVLAGNAELERALRVARAASSRCRSWWPRSPSSAWSIPRARWRWRAPRRRPGPRCASRPWRRPCPPRSPRRAAGGRHWFQLYCFSDEGVTRALMDEAVDSGFEAIVVTVDAPRAGNRERDLRTGFVLPEGLGVPSVQAALGSERAVTVEAFRHVAAYDARIVAELPRRMAAEIELPDEPGLPGATRPVPDDVAVGLREGRDAALRREPAPSRGALPPSGHARRARTLRRGHATAPGQGAQLQQCARYLRCGGSRARPARSRPARS